MHLKNKALSISVFLLVVALAPQAMAIPAFARKFNVNCTTCHTAWPQLNQTGRTFKVRGYLMPDEEGNITEAEQNRQKIGDSLVLEKMLPLAIRAQATPVDLVPNSDNSGVNYVMQPVSDINLMAAGNFFQYGSFFITAEASGNNPRTVTAGNGYAFGVTGRVGFHYFTVFNVIAGYSPLFGIDPYPSLQSVDDPITLHSKLLLGVTFNGVGTLSAPMPFVAINGRLGAVYYSLGLTNGANAVAAVNPRVGQARLAFDITDTWQVGAFGVGGTATQPATPDSNFWLAGIDTNVSTQEYVFSAIGRATRGEGTSDASDTNWGASAEFMYIIPMKGQPHLLPVARVEWLQSGAASANQVRGFLGLSAFVRQNVRVGLDGSVDLRAMDGTPTNWRGTLFADLVF